jgi:hypothetical protein
MRYKGKMYRFVSISLARKIGSAVRDIRAAEIFHIEGGKLT